MMPASICMAYFLSRCLSILAFLLDSPRDCLVSLKREATFFLLIMGEVGWVQVEVEVRRRVKIDGLVC